MASQKLAQSVLRYTSSAPARLLSNTSRVTFTSTRARTKPLFNPHTHRFLTTTPKLLASEVKPDSAAAQAIQTPPAQPPPNVDTEPNRNAAFLGEADSDDGFEANKEVFGDPLPALDAKNSAFLGEADGDDGFEASKVVDGEKLEAVDATNSAFLGEADGDDGFEAHREAHPEEGDHKIVDPRESGLHGQAGELDQ